MATKHLWKVRVAELEGHSCSDIQVVVDRQTDTRDAVALATARYRRDYPERVAARFQEGTQRAFTKADDLALIVTHLEYIGTVEIGRE